MRKFLKVTGAVLIFGVVLLAALAVYGYFIEPARLVINETNLNVPNWDRELNGFKIVAISDIHGGSNSITEERLRSISDTVTSLNPDIVVLLGDFVSQRSRKQQILKMPIETIADNIKGMKAKYGVYAVIGNHDHWYDETKCRKELERVGFKVLENQTASFTVNNKTVTVLGIEDFWKRYKVEIKEPLSKIDPQENIIGITHNPDSFDLTPDTISLLVAGHTHGGQVNLPIIGAPVLVSKPENTKGKIEKDGRIMFVTTGIGTTGPPIRLGVPPEISVLNLYAAE